MCHLDRGIPSYLCLTDSICLTLRPLQRMTCHGLRPGALVHRLDDAVALTQLRTPVPQEQNVMM